MPSQARVSRSPADAFYYERHGSELADIDASGEDLPGSLRSRADSCAGSLGPDELPVSPKSSKALSPAASSLHPCDGWSRQLSGGSDVQFDRTQQGSVEPHAPAPGRAPKKESSSGLIGFMLKSFSNFFSPRAPVCHQEAAPTSAHVGQCSRSSHASDGISSPQVQNEARCTEITCHGVGSPGSGGHRGCSPRPLCLLQNFLQEFDSSILQSSLFETAAGSSSAEIPGAGGCTHSLLCPPLAAPAILNASHSGAAGPCDLKSALSVSDQCIAKLHNGIPTYYEDNTGAAATSPKAANYGSPTSRRLKSISIPGGPSPRVTRSGSFTRLQEWPLVYKTAASCNSGSGSSHGAASPLRHDTTRKNSSASGKFQSFYTNKFVWGCLAVHMDAKHGRYDGPHHLRLKVFASLLTLQQWEVNTLNKEVRFYVIYLLTVHTRRVLLIGGCQQAGIAGVQQAWMHDDVSAK